MAIVIPNQGEAIFLQNILNIQQPQNIVLRLYTNDITIGETTTQADLTECTGGGYGPITLSPGSWTVTQANPSNAAYPQVVFTFTGPPDNPFIYGYYATQATSGLLIYGERFPSAPFQISSSTDTIRITTTFTLAEV